MDLRDIDRAGLDLRGMSDELTQPLCGVSGKLLGYLTQDDSGNDILLVEGSVTLDHQSRVLLCWPDADLNADES